MSDDIKRSVTKDDAIKATQENALTVMIGPSGWSSYFSGLLDGVKGATGLPMYGSRAADAILSETVLIENMWSSAINTAISKQVALGFTVTDDADSQYRIKNAQNIMLNYDGMYTRGLAKHLRDYLTTDNGAFIEIVRQSGAAGSKVIGLRHLDSMRCYRTGDPQRPVVYVDRAGNHHLLRDYQVIALSDMPSPRMEMQGYGICAARRAFETILKLVAIETYVREKVSGARNLAIHIVNGISTAQLEGALVSSEASRTGKGYVVYNGSTIIPMLKSESPSLVTIPLAEIPDGFDAESERRDAYLKYANAIGVFVGEIQPLSGQGLGTGTQTKILNESSEGRGLASWRKAFEHEITYKVLPTTTVFAFAVSDNADRRDKADTLSAWSGALKVLIETQVIKPEQALNVLVDGGYLPRDFLATDETSGGMLADNDKLVSQSDTPKPTNALPDEERPALPVGNLRERLAAMQSVKRKFAQRAKALSGPYLNNETYVADPPSTPPRSLDDIMRLMDKTSSRAKRQYKRAVGDA